MKKILIINGSPRTHGATGQILTQIKEFFEQAVPSLHLETIDLGKMNLQFCSGCLLCYRTGECHIKEDGLEELSKKIEDSDGIVFGSPTYVTNVSGHFKILIDRCHFVFERLLYNKACFSVVTYENFGGGKSRKVINELIRNSGGAVSCNYLVKQNHGDNATNQKRTQQISKLCRRFLVRIEKKNPLSLLERIYRKVSFNIGLKPHAIKNGDKYKAIIGRWMEKGYIK